MSNLSKSEKFIAITWVALVVCWWGFPQQFHWCKWWNSIYSSTVQLQRLTTKDLLGSSLILVEKTILIHCSFQKPGGDHVESLYCHVQGGGRHRCSLGNPAAIWQRQYSRLYDSLLHENSMFNYKKWDEINQFLDICCVTLYLNIFLTRPTCGECLHFLQHDMIGQI